MEETFRILDRTLETYRPVLEAREVGTVTYVGPGTVRVRGLRGVKADELIRFSGDRVGMAFNVSREEVGVVLLDESEGLEAGGEVERTGRVLDVPVSEALLGRVVDALGRPLDDKGPIKSEKRQPLERSAPAIMDRLPVTVPLQTGLKVVDALIPVGRGQRELIVGDRQTGKTAIAVDTILNQKETGVICVYCAVGKRSSAVAKVVAELRKGDTMGYSIVVLATEEDPPGLQFITPYAATTMGEYFMGRGTDVLVVYDDLTRHARAYRELSLLLRRPPGREAYPGDIFYIHSRLLERSTHLKEDLGGGSLSALPIIETEAQNIDQIFLYYCRQLSGANYEPHTVHLLPVDKQWLARIRKREWPGKTIPIFTMDWDSLFSALIRQYLFISLYRAFAESLASENASRLASMQGAEKSIEEQLGSLRLRFHQQRQMSITEELLDIVSGFEALSQSQ